MRSKYDVAIFSVIAISLVALLAIVSARESLLCSYFRIFCQFSPKIAFVTLSPALNLIALAVILDLLQVFAGLLYLLAEF